jgi:hypothetical protein
MRQEYIWALVTLIVAIALAFILLNVAEKDASPQTPRCVSKEDREHMLSIALAGYDQALKEHTVKLFSIWVVDEHDQPGRAQKGTQRGIHAWLKSRELAMKWTPPEC